MKNMTVKRSRLGFTLAELLLVFAILAILVLLGVTGFVALRQNIVIAKYDDMAREIYVAAQNQLTRLDANGTDKAAADALMAGDLLSSMPSDYTPGDWDDVKTSYRFAAQDDVLTMDVLLPLGAVADDVRAGGFYVIEYNADTRMVYSVFYSEGSFDYKTVSGAENFRTLRNVRKEHMVGYYGGSAVLLDPLTHCETPRLEIVNNNELRLNILNVPGDVTVSVRISDGASTVDVPAEMIKSQSSDGRTVLLDSLESGKHFRELFSGLIPGNDLNITVTYEKTGAISSSASVSANSLFATRESSAGGDVVTLAWARHLQNLETGVSGLNDEKITIARQTEHIRWEAEFGGFVSIRNDGANEKLLRFEGSGLEIRDLKGSNGLFAETKQGMELSNIRIVNPVITATGTEPVGALAGTAAEDTKIHMCGVYSNKITDGKVDYNAFRDCFVDGGYATTGGLIGKATNTEVSYSFAALPSLKGGNGASLIGSASGCEISDSYANCDELKPGFNYFVSGGELPNTITHCYAVGNVAAATEGVFSDTADAVTDCYYAVSHRRFAEDPSDNKDLARTQFCRIGTDGSWETVTQEQLQNAVLPGGWASDGWDTMIAPLSHPYREHLNGRPFPYPAIGELDHYGSWPDGDGTVNLTVTMSLLNNEEAGYAVFAGQVIVRDAAGKILFDSKDHVDAGGTFDGENTVQVAPGTEVTIEIKAADGYSYLHTTIEGNMHGATELPVEHTVRSDTEAIITFQQDSFTLKGLPAVDTDGKDLDNSTYSIDLTNPMKTLDIADAGKQESVETGSTVTVRPKLPEGHIASVVWYTPAGRTGEADRTYLTQGADGSYTFVMPAADTDLHVMYTKEESNFNIEYYLMDTEGHYPEKPTQKTTYKCGLGSQINQAMINALTESSWLTVTVGNERVLYLAEGIVTTKANDVVFRSTVDENGKVNPMIGPRTTVKDEDPYNIKIYIARKQYNVTLIADEHVSGVHFEETDTPVPRVTRRFYYGARITARAQVEPGYSFTYWDPQDTRFMMSAEPEYTFQVPHFDLNMKATATTNQYLVTVNLLENGESWLYSDASRQADPITLTLVNSGDDTKTYPMQVLTEDTISYAMQAVVPAVKEYEVGYYVRVDYDSGLTSWIYTSGDKDGTDETNSKLRLYVRDKAVEATADFYSVTYFPNRQNYIGSAPKGGTFPEYYHLTVEGNTGLLRSGPGEAEAIFSGWKDFYAEGTGTDKIYGGGEILMVTRRTDMFAQWNSNILKIIYHAGEATGGELPLDLNQYSQNEDVTIQWGSLKRNGYRFIGWKMDKNSTEPDFTKDNLKYKLTNDSLDLYPVWELEEYTVRFCDYDGTPLTGDGYHYDKQQYGYKITAPDFAVTGKAFIGWSATVGGEVAYRAGEEITVTGDTDLYARFAPDTVKIIYTSPDGSTEYKTELFGKGIPGYLDGGASAGLVTAWSTEPNGKGELYPCDENGRSERAYAFTEDVTLYAVTGKVYNFNERLWFDTLYDAVRSPDTRDGHTLIVYRDTQEPHNVWFNKSLYVISHGNRTVKWKDGATVDNGDHHKLNDKDKEQDEFVGVMSVSKNGSAPVTVEFGRSDITTLSMKGNTLTFDANRQSRVIALANNATFHMYDGITLTNGYRFDENRLESDNGRENSKLRSFFGGGVYAGDGAVFNMHGGTVSHCTAISGGGVYLFLGSRMCMGDMVKPTAFSATAIYYTKSYDKELNEDIYINAEGVTVDNYKNFYITAGEPRICYNTSEKKGDRDGGGGLLMLDLKNGDLTLFRGSITNNTTKANGGGIVTDSGPYGNQTEADKAKLRIYEVDISHNTAKNNGGGIFQWQGTVYVYNSTIRQNQAQRGGGIHLNQTGGETCNIEFYFGDISGNDAVNFGGGVYAQGKAKFLIDGGHLLQNNAQYGGGAYLEGGSTLDFKKGDISENTVTNDGGAVYSYGTINLSGGTLSGNHAENDGGAIWSNGTVTMTGGDICNNNARYLGGGILVEGKFNLSGGSLYGNTDTDYRDNRHADEDNEHPGRNDIYLKDNTVITVLQGGIKLSGEERVSVDCDNDASLRFGDKGLPRRIVEYPDGGFVPKDVYYFTYFGTRSTQYSIENRNKPNLTVRTHTDLGQRTPGLYLAEQTTAANSSYVIFNLNYPDCPLYDPILTAVGTDLHINSLNPVIDTTREGYYLAGWARTPDAIEEQYALYYDVVENKWKSKYVSGEGWEDTADEPIYKVGNLYSQTLYAMWRPCVVVYDVTEAAANAGVTVQPTSVGPDVTLLTPSSLEYTTETGEILHFKYWKNAEDETDTNEYKPMQQLELTENLRLQAVWKVREADKVVFTFHFNSGTSDQTGEMRREVEVVKGTDYQIDVVIRQANKILVGWNTEPDGTGIGYAKDAVIRAGSDMNLYAVWANALTLTYDPNGGFGNSWVVTDREGADVRISDKEPLRDGYAFLGWSTDPKATEAEYKAGDMFTLKEHSTLYAVWKEDETLRYCTVSFDLNGGTGEGFESVQVLGGTSFTVPADAPTRDGYVFGWWDINGTRHEAGSTFQVTSDTALTAIWECYINIDPNGGILNDQEDAQTFRVTENTVFDLKNVNATKDGCILKGWSTDGTATIAYGPDASFTVKNGLTLCAVWEQKMWTITFDLNGGSWSEEKEHTVQDGGSFTIPNAKPTKTFGKNKNFNGWLVQIEGAVPTIYQAGDKITDIRQNITLTAQWKR